MPPTARSRYRGHPRQPPPLKVLIWWWNASKSTGDADFLGCGDNQGVPRVVVLDDQSVEDVLIEVEVLVAESFYTRLVVSVRATNVKPGSLRSGQGAWHRGPRRDGGVPRCSLDDTRVFHVDDDEQLVRVHGDPHPVLPDELSDVPDILAKVSRQAAVQTGTRSEEFSWTISSSRSPEWSRPGINPLLCIGPALRERPFATRETDRQSPTRKFATFTNFRYETTRVRGIMGGPVSPAGIRPPALSDETFPLQVLQDSSHPHSISGDPGGHFFFGD
jgi:hypothetical protein